jgi:hypothetical protein
LFGDTVDAGASVGREIAIGNGLYETSPVNETMSVLKFPNTFTVAKLCSGSGYPFICNDNATTSGPISNLTISFTRPSSEAHIYLNNSTTTEESVACIELHSPRAPRAGHVRSVEVYESGMIRTMVGGCDAN